MNLKGEKHVIQIFDNSYEYTKESRSFEDRKEQHAWKKEITSYSGKLDGDTLWLNKSQIKNSELDKSDFIFLLDHNSDSIQETLEKFGYLEPHKLQELKQATQSQKLRIINEAAYNIEHVFYSKLLNSAFKWKSFRFYFEQMPVIDLNYDEFKLGKPSRDNFTICSFEKNIPTEIKINGKRDMSLFGRRERTYHEMNIIFNYLGTANSLKETSEPIIKKIPSPEKTINLLKTLY
ncbi:hypothetical protein [Gramella sp. KN1008]|uniref:hypothetical protein n=1 Tax=Gramella sp. KN1008 TaxID=2529298 RepID=UPI00103E2947|nr:hypothetical protein [Gramella sp. KN1008]TBW28261.1 hypothetical protein EZJ28_05810 [Gramella sp. KN1008]